MKIELEIGPHCIQTSARQAYERMLKRYLKDKISEDEILMLEKQIEGSVYFLKNPYFSTS